MSNVQNFLIESNIARLAQHWNCLQSKTVGYKIFVPHLAFLQGTIVLQFKLQKQPAYCKKGDLCFISYLNLWKKTYILLQSKLMNLYISKRFLKKIW